MIRIYLAIFLLVIIFIAVRWLRNAPSEKAAEYRQKMGLTALIILLLVLAATGKLNWLFALVGVFVAFIARIMPIFLRYAPALQRLWFTFKTGQQSSGDQRNNQSQQEPINTDKMTSEQAYQILGLKPGASRQDIIKAHKRLMMKVHPDKGGSDFMAAQLNRAKDLLVK